MTMRDAFFNHLFQYAKENPDIIILTSDFSAPSFDRYRIELPGRFVNTGISEQNTILVGAGLACSGKKVFVTSIAPFITMRCFEQIRLYAADMSLDINIVAVGAGFSYNMAGPTHHSIEDIALMRTLPNMKIFSPSCNSLVEAIVDDCVSKSGPKYVRLDRMLLGELYKDIPPVSDNGFNVLKQTKDIMLIASGYMTHTALKAVSILTDQNADVGLIDLYRLPPDKTALLDVLRGVRRIITVDEHVYSGGLGSFVCDLLNDSNHNIPVKRLALDVSDGYYHKYGTRDEMHDSCGIGVNDIIKEGVIVDE